MHHCLLFPYDPYYYRIKLFPPSPRGARVHYIKIQSGEGQNIRQNETGTRNPLTDRRVIPQAPSSVVGRTSGPLGFDGELEPEPTPGTSRARIEFLQWNNHHKRYDEHDNFDDHSYWNDFERDDVDDMNDYYTVPRHGIRDLEVRRNVQLQRQGYVFARLEDQHGVHVPGPVFLGNREPIVLVLAGLEPARQVRFTLVPPIAISA